MNDSSGTGHGLLFEGVTVQTDELLKRFSTFSAQALGVEICGVVLSANSCNFEPLLPHCTLSP